MKKAMIALLILFLLSNCKSSRDYYGKHNNKHDFKKMYKRMSNAKGQ